MTNVVVKEMLYQLKQVYIVLCLIQPFVLIDIYQLIPSKIDPITGNSLPNYDYALIVPENTSLTSASTGTKFLTINKRLIEKVEYLNIFFCK